MDICFHFVFFPRLACRMDELFTLHVHHGRHFMWDPQVYVGGTVDIVDNYDPNKWSKVEIESICREFGYT